ncbi:MAG: MGMT family protein [Candidatus Kapaibacteriota bacterium]|jgi:methylated-DNA-protein-cysteine methyltransferase-like protein
MKDKDIYEKIFEIVRQIPFGKVTTYGHIAKAVGIKMSARMVGWALNSLAFKQSDVPAHRVVNRRGELTGKRYFPSPEYMKELLLSEGITFVGEAVDLNKHLWTPKINKGL